MRADAAFPTTATPTRRSSPTPTGAIVDGDQVLAATAIALRDAGRLRGNMVVTTVMANLGFRRAMREPGIDVVSSRVGDRYVLEEMLRTGAVLGGEQSGHVIFRDRATTGRRAADRGAVPLARGGVGTHDPRARVGDAALPSGHARTSTWRTIARVAQADAVWDAVRRGGGVARSEGRVLVRASGTEPLVRVMVEAETEDLATGAERIADVVSGRLGLTPFARRRLRVRGSRRAPARLGP